MLQIQDKHKINAHVIAEMGFIFFPLVSDSIESQKPLFPYFPIGKQYLDIKQNASHAQLHPSLILRERPNDQSSHPFLFAANDDFTCDTGFRRVRHPDVSNDLPASDGLSEELESVSSGIDRYIGAFKRL
jgi:hypothetical protein